MDPPCGIQCLGLATSYTPWMVSQVTQQVSEHPCCPIWHSYNRSLWLGVSTHVAPYGTCITYIHPTGLIATSHQICLRHFCDLVTHPNVTHQHSGMGKIGALGTVRIRPVRTLLPVQQPRVNMLRKDTSLGMAEAIHAIPWV